MGVMVAALILGPAAGTGAESPEKQMSDAVEVLCPALKGMSEFLGPAQTDLLVRCGEVKIQVGEGQTFGDLSSDQRFALSQMTSDESTTMGTVTVEITGPQFAAVSGRLAALRGGAAGGLAMQFNSDPLDDISHLFAGPGAPPDPDGAPSASGIGDFGRLGVFVNGAFAGGDRDRSTNEPGFDFDHWSFTGGVDYRITDSLILGGALGYAQTETDLDDGLGDIDADGYSVALYGSYYIGDSYIDAIASYARKEYETRRNIDYRVTVPVRQTFTGDSDADEYAVSLGGGHDFSMGGWRFGPYGRLNYLKSEIDGYSEAVSDEGSTDPGFGLAMRVDEQDIESFTSVVGGQVSYAIGTAIGVLTPHLRLDWVHEFANDDRDITAHFLNVPDDPQVRALNTIVIPADDPDRDYATFGLGLSAVFPRGVLGFVDYETVLALSDVSVHQVSGGIRFEF
jgi:uncharacterized protein YhjY with autotransporter beta-barrel domain